MTQDHAPFASVDILGVPISDINLLDAIAVVEGWIAEQRPNFACFRDVHGVMICQEDKTFHSYHLKAGLVAPDGMPLVWAGRHLFGAKRIARVCGPDFLPALCARSAETGHKHFFYGGADGVAERLAANLSERFRGLKVAGCYSPPFRPLTAEEDQAVIDRIDASQADIVWVGLSTPKQEQWMADHVSRLKAPALLGVGAAFDFHAGTVKRAPKWMQKSGTEWLYRLVSEPRRLWRRYLVMAPRFVGAVVVQIVGRVSDNK